MTYTTNGLGNRQRRTVRGFMEDLDQKIHALEASYAALETALDSQRTRLETLKDLRTAWGESIALSMEDPLNRASDETSAPNP